jgi:uncharacterized repeat protein (TIGR03803 family)
MTVTTASSTILDATLSGLTWSPTLGGPVNLTYSFMTAAPATDNVSGFQQISASDQTIISQAIQTFAAVANITFTLVPNGGNADIMFGEDTQSGTAGLTYPSAGSSGTGKAPNGFYPFNAAHIYFANSNQPDPVNFWLVLHELGNATGLTDFSGASLSEDASLGLPANEANFDYTVMANNWPAHGWPESSATVSNAQPTAPFSETPQLLDIQALQYLYGANETGFTTANATTTSSGLVYSFTTNNDAECIWVGSSVPGITTFDFSASSGTVAIDLNAGSFSSTGITPPGESFPTGTGTASYAGTPYDNISIAYGTRISIGIANNNAATLIADSAFGHDDILVGGAGNDTFTAGGGQDIFIGGGGVDTAIFHDASTAYTITFLSPGVVVVTDTATNSTDGNIVLDGDFTTLQFADKTITEASSSTSATTVSAPASVVQANLEALQSLLTSGRASSIVALTSVTSVIERPATGDLLASNTVTITLGFSNAVTITGAPTLALNDGGTATYTSGSGTDALSFNYTVGTHDADVPSLAVVSVNPNAGSVQDLSGHAVFLSPIDLPQSGPDIDTAAPSVTSVIEQPATGALNTGNTLTITLEFNNIMTVAGAPTLTLSNGATATYTGGSGSDALSFSYTVGPRDNDVPSVAVTSINPNGATIQDGAGNTANLSLSGLSQSGPPIDVTIPTLVSFNGMNGSTPEGSLIVDANGDLFGTTESGGTNGHGTVFEIAETAGGYASTPTTLVNFSYTNEGYPLGGLVIDTAGDLFGTTASGGANYDGTVFEIVKTAGGYASTPTVLLSFNGANGQDPQAGLIIDANGDLFGTTAYGGANNDGTVFEIAKTAGGYASTPTVLLSFNGANGQDPQAGLIMDANGDLFGTTYSGGANNDGTVFEIAKTAGGYASTPTVLVNFNGADGRQTEASLIVNAAGDLFGTTGGGAYGDGAVFEIAKTASGYASTPTTLASFNNTDGLLPEAGLIMDAAGDLFGTTSFGGASDYGVVFEVAKTASGYASTPIVLGSFNGPNGDYTLAGLIASAGNLFGTTQLGGANDAGSNSGLGYGTVFEIVNTGFYVLPPAPIDFTDNGYSDILWQNASTGQVAIWEMNGTTATSASAFATVATAWSALGTGDFNGDGYTDILWENSLNRPGRDLGDERHHADCPGRHRVSVPLGLEGGRDRRFQWRWRFRHPVAQ